MKSDRVKTIDKTGTVRHMSRILFDTLSVHKDGTRGQNGLREIFDVGDVHPVAKEVGEYIKLKKEKSVECCGKHEDCNKEHETVAEPVETVIETVAEPIKKVVKVPAKRGRSKK